MKYKKIILPLILSITVSSFNFSFAEEDYETEYFDVLSEALGELSEEEGLPQEESYERASSFEEDKILPVSQHWDRTKDKNEGDSSKENLKQMGDLENEEHRAKIAHPKNREHLKGLEKYIESNPIAKYVAMEVGKPYIYGATGPNAFDCSGLLYYAFNKVGKKIPRTSAEQSKKGDLVSISQLRTGDLIFFDTRSMVEKSVEPNLKKAEERESAVLELPSATEAIQSQSLGYTPQKVTHVGLYIGDDKFIHASSEKTGVKVDSLTSKYYKQRYLFAKRYH